MNKNQQLDLDDQQILSLLKSSNDTAYCGILFDRYLHLVYGLCHKYLKNEEQSKDASMQIFEFLILNLHKYEIDNFKSWLSKLCTPRDRRLTPDFCQALRASRCSDLQI